MNTLAKLLALSGKVLLGYIFILFAFTVYFLVEWFGFGPFVFWSLICGILYYCGHYAYRRWPDHRIFKSSSLWQLGLVAALVMSMAGFVYGLSHVAVR